MPISRAQMRKQISSSPAKKKRAKVKKVMKEFKKGKLRSGGSGKKVKNRKHAVAIALSEAGVSKKKRKARSP